MSWERVDYSDILVAAPHTKNSRVRVGFRVQIGISSIADSLLR